MEMEERLVEGPEETGRQQSARDGIGSSQSRSVGGMSTGAGILRESDSASALGGADEGLLPDSRGEETERLKVAKTDLGAMGEISWLSLPMIFGSLVSFATISLSCFFVGQYASVGETAAFGLAMAFGTCLGQAMGMGLCSGLDTLCSQAFGAREYLLCARWLHRAQCILLLFSVVMLLVLLNTESVLLLCQQDEEVARLAGRTMNWLAPSYVFSFQSEALRRFLNAIGKPAPGVQSSIAVLPVHCLLLWVFVGHLGWGSDGAAMATFGSSMSQLLFLVILLRMLFGGQRRRFVRAPQLISVAQGEGLEETQAEQQEGGNGSGRRGSSCEADLWSDPEFGQALSGWGRYLKISVPAACHVALEWWAFELMTMESGWLGQKSQAAQISLYNFVAINYMVPMGLGAALAAKAGMCVGARESAAGKRYLRGALYLAAIFIVSGCSLFWLFRHHMKLVFTSDPDVASIVEKCLPVVLWYMLLDDFGGTLTGVVRALGFQAYAAGVNLFCFYVIAQPLILFLPWWFRKDIGGLWIASAIGLSVQGLCYIVLIGGADWDKRAAVAARLRDAEGSSGAIPLEEVQGGGGGGGGGGSSRAALVGPADELEDLETGREKGERREERHPAQSTSGDVEMTAIQPSKGDSPSPSRAQARESERVPSSTAGTSSLCSPPSKSKKSSASSSASSTTSPPFLPTNNRIRSEGQAYMELREEQPIADCEPDAESVEETRPLTGQSPPRPRTRSPLERTVEGGEAGPPVPARSPPNSRT